jgi:hypothetical protein
VTSGAGRQQREAARRAVLREARRLRRAWLLSLVAAVGLVVVTVGGVAVALLVFSGSRQAYAATWTVFAVAAAYNVTRFVPRAPEMPGVAAAASDVENLVVKVASWTGGWRPHVRLVLEPGLREDFGVLVLGVPMLACLRESELAELVRDAHEVAEPDTDRGVVRALRIVRGGLGRGLWDRTGHDAWMSRFLLRGIVRRAADLSRARGDFTHTVRMGQDESWNGVTATADTVVEAWDIVVDRWLGPALERGVWHADPSTGLRSFLAACEEGGFIESPVRRLNGGVAGNLVANLAGYERALMETALEDRAHDVVPTDWADHPSQVTEPAWRTTLAAGLEAARQATGQTQHANLDALMGLYENGWGPALAAVLAPDTGAAEVRGGEGNEVPPAEYVRVRLLSAAVSVALLDSGLACLEWSWLHGTFLRHRDGTALRVPDAIGVLTAAVDHTQAPGNHGAMRTWVAELGLNLRAPLWLDGGVPPGPERPLWATEAFRGMRTYHLVATRRALRLFRRTFVQGCRERIRMMMSGPGSVLDPQMQAVAEGCLAGQEIEIDLSTVVRATFAPRVGGHWWGLTLHTPQDKFVFWGKGIGRDAESWFADLLGDRLTTRWLHTNRWLLWIRNAFGYLCLSLGGLGVVCGLIFIVIPQTGISRGDASLLCVTGAGVLAVGFIPDLVAAGLRRRS